MSTDPLVAHIASHSSPLSPVATGEEPILGHLESIRSVVFDIYGTLIISGSGDISLVQSNDRSPALRAALETAGLTIRDPAADWSATFFQTLAAFREARQLEGIPFPEVRIEEVWEAFVGRAREEGWLDGDGDIQRAIVDHECRVNPCWPMPGLSRVLDALNQRGFLLGIVSNAQFYTPLMFPAFLGQSLSQLGFREDLGVWSFKEREGKPSVHLYRILEQSLKAHGIVPGEVLYVGNDLRNDVMPAQKVGYRTALFAGDARSLRWRKEDPDSHGCRPDRVITELEQILDML